MVDLTFDIDLEGNMHGLYTDEINLFSIGKITNIHKASNIEFNEENQCWEVLSLSGKVLHRNTNREVAIDWEIINFSPGGKYYVQGTL